MVVVAAQLNLNSKHPEQNVDHSNFAQLMRSDWPSRDYFAATRELLQAKLGRNLTFKQARKHLTRLNVYFEVTQNTVDCFTSSRLSRIIHHRHHLDSTIILIVFIMT